MIIHRENPVQACNLYLENGNEGLSLFSNTADENDYRKEKRCTPVLGSDLTALPCLTLLLLCLFISEGRDSFYFLWRLKGAKFIEK